MVPSRGASAVPEGTTVKQGRTGAPFGYAPADVVQPTPPVVGLGWGHAPESTLPSWLGLEHEAERGRKPRSVLC